MATEVPEVNHGETTIWSIYNCILCNELLNGKSYILECLHIICMNCAKLYTINSSKYFLLVFIISLMTE